MTRSISPRGRYSFTNQPRTRIDARAPDAKELRLRSVNRDIGGNITGGIDTLTGERVNAPAPQGGPGGLRTGTGPSDAFREAFGRPTRTWNERQAANQQAIVAARNRMDPTVAANTQKAVTAAQPIGSAVGKAFGAMGGPVAALMGERAAASGVKAAAPAIGAAATDANAANAVTQRVAQAGDQIRQRAGNDQFLQAARRDMVTPTPYGTMSAVEYQTPAGRMRVDPVSGAYPSPTTAGAPQPRAIAMRGAPLAMAGRGGDEPETHAPNPDEEKDEETN